MASARRPIRWSELGARVSRRRAALGRDLPFDEVCRRVADVMIAATAAAPGAAVITRNPDGFAGFAGLVPIIPA
jgi:predicted nucleic acid-binding protein